MTNSDHPDRTTTSRREALLLSATAGLGAAFARPATALASSGRTSQQPGRCSTPRSAVAKTQYGKVRGYVDGRRPDLQGHPLRPEYRRRKSLASGQAPDRGTESIPLWSTAQTARRRLHDFTAIEQSFLQDWDDGYMSEDMLKLNIWTPSLTGKRPVMVYIHGGGFTFGSSYELASQDGAQMARHHDVVQVSVNHRLNALGFLDVSEIGGDGLCGLGQRRHDRPGCRAALDSRQHRQLRRRSGQGHDLRPVRAAARRSPRLMGMPSAAGLFHRASVQSGGGGNPPEQRAVPSADARN